MEHVVPQRPFESARELLGYLLSNSDFVPGNIFEATTRGTNNFIFRGQPDCSQPLLPAAHRNNEPLRGFTPQPPPRLVSAGTKELREHLGFQLNAELRASNLFLGYADNLGLSTPIDFSIVRTQSDLMLAALRGDEYRYEEDFPHAVLIPGLALAQHHGVPTRLLDWTESPLVAAFFAALEASVFAKVPPNPDGRLGIFVLDLTHYRTTLALRIAEAPRHAHTFLRVQRGLFTYVASANYYFLNNEGRWPSVVDALSESGPVGSMLTCYTLPVREANGLLRLLLPLGVTRHALMPSLDNAAKAFEYHRALFER